ncbi:PQQ-binding-like beta-propeller repeat protein [Stagnihabitans tardus]|uniref:PQQ-binding-like beta-propeller repeat protein n=1 Tax=Stagnihabitans tardus TaxID=2699202 RepID=A0AAE5BVT7_9RHOB|nr:PQQ-binding-like beta-propeller repeat protein [Stagnihabitans tardus]NBZ87588.1 PQQ-binding-like beta-propeller repeat protein [Stagnihabitans tardus]
MQRLALGLMISTLALSACQRDRILEGTRFPLRAPLEASVPSEAVPDPAAPPDRPENVSAAISLPGMVSNGDWGQRGGNAGHTGVHGALSAQPALAWAVDIGAGSGKRSRITAAPVVAGGRVFAMDGASHVTAVSVAGERLWSADVNATFDRSGGISGGSLAADGARAYAVTGYGEVVGLDAGTGAVVWRQRLGAQASGAPLLADGRVYVAADDGTAWAIDAASGRVVWTAVGVDNLSNLHVDGGAAPVQSGALVVFPFASGLMMAVETSTGQPVWNAYAGGERLGRGYAVSGTVTGDPVVSGGMMFAGTAAGRTGAWSLQQGQVIWDAPEGAMNAPLVFGGSVFVVNDEATLVRLSSADGSQIWASGLPYFDQTKPKRQGRITASYGPVLAGGRVWVASSDGRLRGFAPQDGSLVADVALPGGAASAPALAQGMIFVVTGRGQLLAFR